MEESSTAAIQVKGLTYAFPNGVVGLEDIDMELPRGSRTVLIGANGAGKSTLLRLVAGKTLAKGGDIRILGVDPFRDGIEGITYLGTEWALNPIVHQDMPVATLLSSVGGDYFATRRDTLIDILDIDLTWHMHAISDGERRRVQLAMGLLRPWRLLLLDEVTVDLDVLVRARLLEFLKNETESRLCTILYATHIFDGLADWPSHIGHLHMGKIIDLGPMQQFAGELAEATANSSTRNNNNNSALLMLALKWLKQDLSDRGARKDIKRIKWQDLSESDKSGGITSTKGAGFAEYFRISSRPE